MAARAKSGEKVSSAKPIAAVIRLAQKNSFLFYLFEENYQQQTGNSQSGHHASQCHERPVFGDVGGLPQVECGPVVAYTFDTALEKEDKTE